MQESPAQWRAWTFAHHAGMKKTIDQIPEVERLEFSRIGLSIGGLMFFSMGRVDRKYNINQARGTHPCISDRFDLTLECIRRYYKGNQWSPLQAVMNRYDFFFELSGDFESYVDFFLLQDLVTDDYSAVKFFVPFNDFAGSPLPAGVKEYASYRERTLVFLHGRNLRIAATNVASSQTATLPRASTVRTTSESPSQSRTILCRFSK
jgi:hypothetical protein